MLKEIWVQLKENKYYEISNYGRIKSNRYWVGNHWVYREKILKQPISKNGYKMVSINCKRYYVHRLVAKYFLIKENNKNFVNHLDGNKLNNNVNNLEWCSIYENNVHAINNNLRKIKKIIQKNKNNEILKIWNSMKEINETLGFEKSSICVSCKTGKVRYGYYWEYYK